MKLPLVKLVLSGCMLVSCALQAQPYFVDALSGNDANAGSISAPLKTIDAARQLVAQVNVNMQSDIHVYLREGVHRLNEPVVFGPEDSGRNGFRVIYRAYDAETPIISGGIPVTNWILHDAAKNIYKAQTTVDGFRQVYIDDTPGIRSRTPNREFAESFGPYWRLEALNYANKQVFLSAQQAAALAGVAVMEQVEMVMISHWYQQRLLVGGYQETATGANFIPLHPGNKFTKEETFYTTARSNTHFYFENSLAFVDAPGEWYHDRSSGTLYLCLAPGMDPNSMTITIPTIEHLITIDGTAGNRVENLSFEGLTFECSNWTSPSEKGLNVTQFAQPIGTSKDWNNRDYPAGMLRARHARNLILRGNTFRNAGAHAIQFHTNVDDSKIVGNTIMDIAANGIEIDTHAAINPGPDLQSTDLLIANNLIVRCGQNYSNGGGMLAHNVRRLTFEHNEVHTMPYSGIQIGNQPGVSAFRDIGCGENIIRRNYIHHCMLLHDDGAAIYTLGGIQTGTIIYENYVHDILAKTPWTGGIDILHIYLDNYTSGILVENNVCNDDGVIDVREKNGAGGNILRNNVLQDSLIEALAGMEPRAIPPSPDPMTFLVVSPALDDRTIRLVASTAEDPFGPVQYYFENQTNGDSSGWINSREWLDTGLTQGTLYSFRVKARDVDGFETAWSDAVTAATSVDNEAPLPDPMGFESPPAALSETSITMTALTAFDISGVEYYFECTSGDCNDSGWQVGRTYTDTGLTPGSLQTYRVRTRDLSNQNNLSQWSPPASAWTAFLLDLINGDFEAGEGGVLGAVGWTISSGAFYTANKPVSSAKSGAFEGTQYLTAERSATDPASPHMGNFNTIFQIIDLSSYSQEIDDGNSVMDLRFHWATADPYDDPSAVITFYEASGRRLGRPINSGEVDPTKIEGGSQGIWFPARIAPAAVPIPVGARSVKIEFNAFQSGSGLGTFIQTSFDSVVATIAFPYVETDEGFWAGLPVDPSGHVDTGSWLGVLYVLHAPFIYSYQLGWWIYLKEDHVMESGAWIYIFK